MIITQEELEKMADELATTEVRNCGNCQIALLNGTPAKPLTSQQMILLITVLKLLNENGIQIKVVNPIYQEPIGNKS